jgi:hypothetical protein
MEGLPNECKKINQLDPVIQYKTNIDNESLSNHIKLF